LQTKFIVALFALNSGLIEADSIKIWY